MPTWNINTDTIQSNQYMLYVAEIPTTGDPVYKVLGYGKSNGLNLSQDTSEASSKFSCAWKANQATRIGYQVTADALYCTNDTDASSFDTLVGYMVSQKNIAWALGQAAAHVDPTTGEPLPCDTNPFTLDTTKDYYNGIGLITSLDLNAEEDSVVSCSLTLDGSGEILKNGQPIQ